MSRIDDATAGGRIRSASDHPITARMEGRAVDEEVAPMLPDLLTRPEAISGRANMADLPPPRPNDAVDPPSPTEELQVLRRLESKLDAAAGQMRDAERAEAVETMLRSVRYFRSLREEVVMRADV